MKPRGWRWPGIAVPPPGEALSPLWKRLLWMAGLWAISVGVLTVVALLIRAVLRV